ncbi:hypothetical protein GCM10022381_41390 [Leifsonia kafniensis]|uniref:Uncharacterized protein n=1 Tax=Leifsonia kafniensis TaxID=475957 RepID=A0ABP7L7A0_9MICO
MGRRRIDHGASRCEAIATGSPTGRTGSATGDGEAVRVGVARRGVSVAGCPVDGVARGLPTVQPQTVRATHAQIATVDARQAREARNGGLGMVTLFLTVRAGRGCVNQAWRNS